MNYFTIKPEETLADYVRCFWVFEGDVKGDKPYIHRTMASGCPELLFHYKGQFDELNYSDQQVTSFISGIHAQTNQFRRFIVKEEFGIFGVYLFPHTINLLFGIPTDELSNEMPDLFSLFGKEGSELEEKVMLATNNSSRVNLVSQFLISKLSRSKPRREIIRSIKHVVGSNGDINVEQLAEACALSKRQFERIFKIYSGFSPKLYSRIIRFNATISIYKKDTPSLTDIAYEFGYYDQSHFIQDFKEFSGYNPRAYFLGPAEGRIS
jgi:AraC-like DNA-binding protein